MEINKLDDLIRDVVRIWQNGAVCYMSDSEEEFQREVFCGLLEYLEELELKDKQ